MKCRNCGFENEANAKFCQKCGNKLFKKQFDANKLSNFVYNHKKSLLLVGGIFCLILIGIAVYNYYDWNYHHDFTVQNPNTEKYSSSVTNEGYTLHLKPYMTIDGKHFDGINIYPAMDAEALGKTSKDINSILNDEMVGSINSSITQITLFGEPAVLGEYTDREVTFKELESSTVGEEKEYVMVHDKSRPLMKYQVVLFKKNDKVYKFKLSSLEKDYIKADPDFASFVYSFKLKT